jgi:cytochrome c oxidase subunit 3
MRTRRSALPTISTPRPSSWRPGFHGFHVIVGTIFLAVCLARCQCRSFHAPAAFRLRGRAWYWHFVDVVWLFLFLAIYVWGGWGAEYHG